MNIGTLIHNRRKELGLTLEDVGKAVGVSKSTVKKWETGFIANIKRDKIASLANVLDINPVSLITGDAESVHNVQLKAAQNEQPLTDKQQEIMNICSKLSNEDIDKVIEYVEFIKSKRNQ